MFNKNKNHLFGNFQYLFVVTILLFNCSSSGPTGSSTPTLADQIIGNFIGTIQNPSGNTPNYQISVIEINSTRVKVAPTSGSSSSTFEADLELDESGSVATIILKSPDDILENNGTFVASTGKLSYAFHLGGTNDYSVEVFIGDKQ